MTKPQLNQSNEDSEMPYVAVGTDQRNSACWLLVQGKKITEFVSGSEAFRRLNAAICEQQKAGPDK